MNEEESLASHTSIINHIAEEIRERRRREDELGIPMHASGRSEVERKARFIRRELHGRVDYSILDYRDHLLWRLVAQRNAFVTVPIEEFMDRGFDARVLVDHFAPHLDHLYQKRADSSPAMSSAEEVNRAIQRMTQMMNLSTEKAQEVAAKMLSYSLTSEDAGKVATALGSMVPDVDEEVILARAEAGIAAMVMDIHASILDDGDAMRERASYWLTTVTARITKALEIGEGG